jgi:type I restriction enzyme, R subunit
MPNDHPMLRPYQFETNAAVEQAAADRKRQMLLAMATGTGKTFTMVNQVYRFMKSGVAKRILFLVDGVPLPPRPYVPLPHLRQSRDLS